MISRLRAAGLAGIDDKLRGGERLAFEDGVRLFECGDLLAVGYLANREREKRHGARTFAYLEDVVRANLSSLFPGTQVRGAHLFRVVRDADLVIQEDEADDLLESVDRSLKQLRWGALSLLEVDERMPPRVLRTLVENFEVGEDIVERTADLGQQ